MTLIKRLIVWLLTAEARIVLNRHRPFIVAVTGSVGKTTTKDAIYEVLTAPGICKADGSGLCHVRKSEKSLNSDIGLPLTILGVPNAWYSISGWIGNLMTGLALALGWAGENGYPDCLVLEVGADHPGDIRKVVRWLKPDIAVITKVSRTPVHVEFFESPEQVFAEKSLLAEATKKGGTVVVFGDDERTVELGRRLSASGREIRSVSFGISENATVRARDLLLIRTDGTLGSAFTLDIRGETLPVSVPGVIGVSQTYSLLAAAAVGSVRGMSLADIAAGISRSVPPKGRLNAIAGRNGSLIIDDTYNSSPDAARAAVAALVQVSEAGIGSGAPSRPIAVLGDMMELGRFSADEHRAIGAEAARALGTHGILVAVGPRSQAAADQARASGLSADRVHVCASADAAVGFLSSLIQAGDIILVKGSQSMRMERVVKALMKEPEKAADLLVRQEPEWLEKQ